MFFLCFDQTTLLLGSTAKSRRTNLGDGNGEIHYSTLASNKTLGFLKSFEFLYVYLFLTGGHPGDFENWPLNRGWPLYRGIEYSTFLTK